MGTVKQPAVGTGNVDSGREDGMGQAESLGPVEVEPVTAVGVEVQVVPGAVRGGVEGDHALEGSGGVTGGRGDKLHAE